MRLLRWMTAPLLLLATSLALSAETDLVGRYGHDATEPADEPVWQVERAGDSYSIEYLAVGERELAWRLDGDGRAAFWERMTWPAATARDAQCLSWGVAPQRWRICWRCRTALHRLLSYPRPRRHKRQALACYAGSSQPPARISRGLAITAVTTSSTTRWVA
ncbi:MAG: hypothetical protein ACREPE_07895 [Lysobacter sp.]